MARAATTSDVFNAIAEPQRREILALLRAGERPVTDLARELRMTQPGASKHLRVLREVGLVRDRKAGKQRLYGLNAGGLIAVAIAIGCAIALVILTVRRRGPATDAPFHDRTPEPYSPPRASRARAARCAGSLQARAPGQSWTTIHHRRGTRGRPRVLRRLAAPARQPRLHVAASARSRARSRSHRRAA